MAGFEKCLVPGDTYRTHDGCLPVKLSRSQHLCPWRVLAATMSAKRPQARGSCTMSDVPGHLRWGQLSMKREGHYGCTVSQRCPYSWCCEAARPHSRQSAPQSQAVMRANGQASPSEEGARTYRPRSVSSLLMRLRAMAVYVCGVVGVWVCGSGERVGSGGGEEE
jgi:hypothetical protein